MATATAPRKTRKTSSTKSPAEPKVDAYQVITDRIIALLEKGVAAWRKPWSGADAPTSLSTGKSYRGINALILALTAMEKGYTSPFWGTWNQIQARGGRVRKGEKGTQVVLWKQLPITDEATGEVKVIWLLKLFTVFNTEQTDGAKLPEVAEPLVFEGITEIDAALAPYLESLAGVSHGGDSAQYSPATDRLAMPARESFRSVAAYYDALFHEAVHSTGAQTRLDREGVAGFDHFGSQRYAREELVAQLGASFLSGHFGLLPEVEENSAAYVANWIQALKNDKKMIVKAATEAQKAADWILGRSPAPMATED